MCPSVSKVLDDERLEALLEDIEYEEAALLAQFVDRDDVLEGALIREKSWIGFSCLTTWKPWLAVLICLGGGLGAGGRALPLRSSPP